MKEFLQLKTVILILGVILSGYAFCDGVAAIDEATRQISDIMGKIGALGIAVGAGLWIIDYLFPIKFMDSFIAEHKRKMIFLVVFFGVMAIFKNELAEIYTKVTNPVAMFRGE